MQEGSAETGDEETAEILNAFFASVFNVRTSCPQDSQLLELEVGDGKKNEAPIIQEVVSDMPCQLDTQSLWVQSGKRTGQTTLHHLPALLVNWRSFIWLEISKCNSHLQEGLEG